MYLRQRLSSFHSHLNFTEEDKYNNLCFDLATLEKLCGLLKPAQAQVYIRRHMRIMRKSHASGSEYPQVKTTLFIYNQLG